MYDNLKDAVHMALLSVGVTFSVHVYFGGMILAISCCLIMRHFSKDAQSTSKQMTIVTSIVLSTMIGAAAYNHIPNISVQIVMGATGFVAVPLIKRFAARSEDLADKAIDKVAGDK